MSRARRTQAGLMLALALACGRTTEPAASVAEDAERAGSARFVPGEVLRFRVDWQVESTAAMAGVLPDEVPVSGGLHLVGTLALRVVGPTEGGSLVGLAFERLDTHEVTIMGQNVLPESDPLLGHEAFLVVRDDGEAGKLYFDPRAPSLFRHLMTGLAGQTELRIMPRDQASHVARIASTSGVAEAKYTAAGNQRFARSLQRYVRFDAASTTAAPRVEGHATIALDERDLLVRMDAEETVSAAIGSGEDETFASQSNFSLVREGIEVRPVVAGPVLADLVEHDLLGLPDDSEAQRVLAQRFAEDIELIDVVIAIRSASHGLRPPPGFMIEATGLLRGWPENAAELEGTFWAESNRGRELTIDLLSSAGTPEAQAILCRILGDVRLREDPTLPALIQRLSFLWRPMPATASFVLERHADARDHQRTDERAALLYPMGTIAGRIEPLDPLLAEALLGRVREELGASDPALRVPTLAGLGNAGAAADLPTVLAFVDDADAATRAQAGSSLRAYASTDATQALFVMLYDPDWTVSQMALSVLDAYQLSERDSDGLAAVALGGGFSRELDGRMISALGRRRNDHPWVRPALLAMRDRQEDPTERSRVDGILADE